MAQGPTFDEYTTQVTRELGFDDETAASQAFEFNIRAARQTLEQSTHIIDLFSVLKAAAPIYAPGRPELLFQLPHFENDVRFGTKTYKSAIDKFYRRNVLYNRRFPQPAEGSIEPSNLYEQIDDLIRTRIICKYMDGPQFLCEQLSEHFKSKDTTHVYREVSTDAGYYAWHFYFKFTSEIMIGSSVVSKSIWVEIQFATQLSEVITILTHDLYKIRRVSSAQGKR